MLQNEIDMPWLSRYPSEIPWTIDYDEKPLQDYLKEAAKESPHKKAIHFLGKELTFEELYTQSLKLANYLLKLGLKKGERVGIMLPNCPQAVISYYGILLAGGIVTQINPMYTERELAYQLKDAEAKMIICLDLLYPRVLKVTADTSIIHTIVTKIEDYLPFPKNLLYPIVKKKSQPVQVKVIQGEKTHVFKHVIKESKADEIDLIINPKEDLALLQYTGGTTGQAKGVMLTHHNLVSNTIMCIRWLYKYKKGEEKILGILPFFHVFGMTAVMNYSIMFHSQMILLPKFDPEETLKTIEKLRPTQFPGAPTMYIALLNHPDISKYDLSSIESCISGSAPLPVEVQERFEQATGGKIVEGYGLTEASPVTHANLLWGQRIKGSIGLPWPDTDAMILSLETNQRAEINEVGELLVKGPQVMKGYWRKPEETFAVFHEDEWLKTGDLGYMDEKGYFYIVDRKKDMIIAGGFNIYPREIEEVLYEHKKVLEAVAVGVPDPYRGETVKVFIVLKQGETVSEKEIEEHCAKYLAAYKVPKLIELRDELPKTAVGKILRRTLAEEEKAKQQKKNA
jgi:long-chain acyl-CoA synthetase